MFFPLFRRCVALLLVLALFAPGSAFGRVLYACSMSGKVSAGRCCCHQAKQAPPSKQAQSPQIQAPGCCDVQDHRRAAAPASHTTSEILVLAPAMTGLLPAIAPASEAAGIVRISPHAARGPPPRSPAYVVNCSLLI